MMRLQIGDRWIGPNDPIYFIADISANHDGDLERAKELVRLAKEGGADAAKFQNFRAAEIVSDYGFKAMGSQVSHQSKWKKSVFEAYEDASLPWEWTGELKDHCDSLGIQFLSTPYDFAAVDMLDPYVPAFKIGSGDITWPEMLGHVAGKGKPVILATGASDMGDVQRAIDIIRPINARIVLLQCNTNYTASLDNFRHIQLNAMYVFRAMYPDVVLGLSDHTPGHATVLGAVALGGRVIEKHFTDDTSREGPDHPFSMDPVTWKEMVERTRELELALGTPDKRVQENEAGTVLVQRRCVRAAAAIAAGTPLTREHFSVLRPVAEGAILPYEIEKVPGRRARVDIEAGEHISWDKLE